MILGGGKLKLGGGNPPFPRVLYETLRLLYQYWWFGHACQAIFTVANPRLAHVSRQCEALGADVSGCLIPHRCHIQASQGIDQTWLH